MVLEPNHSETLMEVPFDQKSKVLGMYGLERDTIPMSSGLYIMPSIGRSAELILAGESWQKKTLGPKAPFSFPKIPDRCRGLNHHNTS